MHTLLSRQHGTSNARNVNLSFIAPNWTFDPKALPTQYESTTQRPASKKKWIKLLETTRKRRLNNCQRQTSVTNCNHPMNRGVSILMGISWNRCTNFVRTILIYRIFKETREKSHNELAAKHDDRLNEVFINMVNKRPLQSNACGWHIFAWIQIAFRMRSECLLKRCACRMQWECWWQANIATKWRIRIFIAKKTHLVSIPTNWCGMKNPIKKFIKFWPIFFVKKTISTCSMFFQMISCDVIKIGGMLNSIYKFRWMFKIHFAVIINIIYIFGFANGSSF